MRPEERQRVLDSALELCERHSLSDIGLDQLARAAGVSALDIVRTHMVRGLMRAQLEAGTAMTFWVRR